MSFFKKNRTDAPGPRPPEGSPPNKRISFLGRRSPEGSNPGSSNKGGERVSPGPLTTAEPPPLRNPSASPAARTPETGSAKEAKGEPGAQTKGDKAKQSGEQKPGKQRESEAQIAEAGALGAALKEAAGQSDDSSSNQSSQDNTNRGDLNSSWPPEGEWKTQWEQAVGGDKTISHLDNLRSTSDGTVSEHAMALQDGNGNVLAIETDTRYFNSKDKSREPDERQVYTRFADGRVIEQQFSKTRSSDGRSRVLEYTRRESDPNGAGPVISRNLTLRDDSAWEYTESGPDGTKTISHQFDSSQQKWMTTETLGSQTKEIGEPSRAPLDHSQTLRDLGVEIPSDNMIESPLESLANADPAADVISIEEGGPTPEHPASEGGGTGKSGAEESTATPSSSTEQDKPNIEQPVNNESARTTGEPPVAGTDKGNESSGSAEATPTQQAGKPPETPATSPPDQGNNSGGDADTGKPPAGGDNSGGDAGRGDKSEISPEAKEAASSLARDYDAALDIPPSPEEAKEQGFQPDPPSPRAEKDIETTTRTRTTLNGDGSMTQETIKFKKLPDGKQQTELTRDTQLKETTISERASRKIVTDTSGNRVVVTRLERTSTPQGSPAVREVITHTQRTNSQRLEHTRTTKQLDGTVRTERAATNYNSAGQPVNSSYSVETGTINAKVNTHEDGTITYRQSTDKGATGSDFPPGTTAILDYDAQGRLISSKVLDADGKTVANPENHPFVQGHIALNGKIEPASPQQGSDTGQKPPENKPGHTGSDRPQTNQASPQQGSDTGQKPTGNGQHPTGSRRPETQPVSTEQGGDREQKLPEQQRPGQRERDQRAPESHRGNGNQGADMPRRDASDQRAPESRNANGGSSNVIRIPTEHGMVEVPTGSLYVGGNFKGGWGNNINSPQIIIGKGGGRERGRGDIARQTATGLVALNIALGHTLTTEAHGAERVASSAAHH